MQLTSEKKCPQCGSSHVIYIGNWAEVKYDDDIPRANFLDTDSVYWCEGSECNAVFALRKENSADSFRYSSYL